MKRWCGGFGARGPLKVLRLFSRPGGQGLDHALDASSEIGPDDIHAIGVTTPGSGVGPGRNRGSIHEFAKGADLNNGRRAEGGLDRSPFSSGLSEPGLFRVVVAAKFPLVLPVTGESAFLGGDGSEIPFVMGREPAQIRRSLFGHADYLAHRR